MAKPKIRPARNQNPRIDHKFGTFV